METTTFDTYGTAAPGFAQGVIALGNDAGILSVGFQSSNEHSLDTTETDVVGLLHLVAVLGLFLLTCFVFALRDWQQFAKNRFSVSSCIRYCGCS